jgi:glycosyltransferase involved in cell wall biosynthesis
MASITTRQGLLSVIIPVFNERNSIQAVIDAVCRVPGDKEIVVVDDGSDDGSAEVVSAGQSRLIVMRHERNSGKGSAIRTALKVISGEYVIIQDADLEYDPRDYVRMLAPLRAGVADAVFGVRRDDYRRGILYFAGARLLTWWTNILYLSRLHDQATGYKAMRSALLRELPLTSTGFDFCAEVTAHLLLRRARISEVSISYHPRNKYDGKKIRLRDGLAALWCLARLRLRSFCHVMEYRSLTATPINSGEGERCVANRIR